MRLKTWTALALIAAALNPGCGEQAPPAMTLRYEVAGMHCDGCAEAIVAEVKEVPGVTRVACTYESREADVTVNDPGVRSKVEHAITKLGYKIAPLAAAPEGAASSK